MKARYLRNGNLLLQNLFPFKLEFSITIQSDLMVPLTIRVVLHNCWRVPYNCIQSKGKIAMSILGVALPGLSLNYWP